MCQRGWIKRVCSTVYKTPKVLEKSDERITHEACSYLNDIIIRRKSQRVRPTLPLSGNGLGSGLAERLAKKGSEGKALVTDLLRRGSLKSPMVEIAHNAIREYPDKGFDVVCCFMHDPFRIVLTTL
jgi:hypothetical protein